MNDAHEWITFVCDADLRKVMAFERYAESVTLGSMMELQAVFESRQAALAGGSSLNEMNEEENI